MRALRTPQEPRRFAGTTSISPDEPVPWSPSLKKKRKLSSELSLTFSSYFALPPFLTVTSQVSPRPGSGILTGFPFDRLESYIYIRIKTTRFRKAFASLLGPTDPCATAVHMEPFSTSVFKVLTRIFATTTKICTNGSSIKPRGLTSTLTVATPLLAETRRRLI